jgi:hypothetical protein
MGLDDEKMFFEDAALTPAGKATDGFRDHDRGPQRRPCH